MRHANLGIALLALASATLPVQAGTWVRRDVSQMSDTHPGPTAPEDQYLPSSGKSSEFWFNEMLPLHSRQPEVLAVQLLAFQSARAASQTPVIVPQGTLLRVRTSEFIDVDSTQAGASFRGALDDPIIVAGDVIVPRGADVILVAAKVEQGGRMKGSDLIALKVDFIFVKGRSSAVVTTISETKSGGEGKKTTGKVVGGAGLGALIGGIAGGGKGAGIGALVGVAGGTVLAATGEPHLKIPAETRLQFQLMADWKIK